jgi:hypothetical protein
MHARIALLVIGLTATVQSALADPPPNDFFATPVVIVGFPLTAFGTNVDATLEGGEPLPEGYENLVSKSIWFEWTAPTSGLVQLDTYGSTSYWQGFFGPPIAYDMIAHPAVWVGETLQELTEIKSGGNKECRYLNVVSGTTYRIAVYGIQNGATYDWGDIILNIGPDASGHIEGTVTQADGGAPLEGILAQANRWNPDWGMWVEAAWAFTDAAGNYTIRGLSNDTYRVAFVDWENRNGTAEYLTEYYDNQSSWESAADIPVSTGGTVGGIHAALAQAARISGTVTGPNGNPVVGIWVSVHSWDEGEEWWMWMGEAQTDENGAYTIAGLNAGTYRVRFADWDDEYYVLEAYNNSPSLAAGTDISVGEAAVVTGIDAVLAMAEPSIVGLSITEGVVEVQFTGIEGRDYILQSGRVASNDWTDVGAEITCQDGTNSLSDADAGSGRAWRVRRYP